MGRILYLVGATVGGWVGWVAVERLGLMAAFLGSVVGTAAGVYAAGRVSRRFLG